MRKLSRFLSSSVLIAAGACTVSSGTPLDARPTPPAIDAPPIDAPPIDAPPVDSGPAGGVATEVDCITAATPAFVSTSGFMYNPMNTTINRGTVVKFTMPAEHDVASSVAGLVVPFNTIKCLTFGTPGTYTFHCTPHQFVGTIKVQ
jgi:plastocyanin